MKTKEIEIPIEKNKPIPKEMDCPVCYAKIEGPQLICKVCNSQVIFVEE